MEKIFRTDISEKKEFSFEGDTLKQKECVDEENHIYVYERYNWKGRLYGYEVVKGVRKKQPSGDIVYVYPSSEQFGKYGYFISSQYAEKDIPVYVEKLKQKGDKLSNRQG